MPIFSPKLLASSWEKIPHSQPTQSFNIALVLTQDVRLAPRLLIKQGGLAGGQRGRRDRRTAHARPCSAGAAERPRGRATQLTGCPSLRALEKKLYELLSTEDMRHLDDLVERLGFELFGSSGYAFRPGDERRGSAITR